MNYFIYFTFFIPHYLVIPHELLHVECYVTIVAMLQLFTVFYADDGKLFPKR